MKKTSTKKVIPSPTKERPSTFNYLTLITQKNLLHISFLDDQSETFISSNSLKRIIKMLNPNPHPYPKDLEQLCYQYITCAIASDELSGIDPASEGEDYELDPIFINLLTNRRSFFINTPHAQANNSPLMITDFSLRKITSLLNETVVSLSDFISVAIFVFSQEELHNRYKSLSRLSLRANILDKYSHVVQYPLFEGIAKVPIDLPYAERNMKVNISDFDYYLDNVEAFLAKKKQKNCVLFSARQYKSNQNVAVWKPVKYTKKIFSRQTGKMKEPLSPFVSSDDNNSRRNSLKDNIEGDGLFNNNNHKQSDDMPVLIPRPIDTLNNSDSISFNEDDIILQQQQQFNQSNDNKSTGMLRGAARPKKYDKENDTKQIMAVAFNGTPAIPINNNNVNVNISINSNISDGNAQYQNSLEKAKTFDSQVIQLQQVQQLTSLKHREFQEIIDQNYQRRLIPDEYIQIGLKALNGNYVNRESMNLYDNNGKVCRLNTDEIINKKFAIGNGWIEVWDMHDNPVYVRKEILERKLKEKGEDCSEVIMFNDFNEKSVGIRLNSRMGGNVKGVNQLQMQMQQRKKTQEGYGSYSRKKVFVVRLAKIEISDLSNYYTSNPIK